MRGPGSGDRVCRTDISNIETAFYRLFYTNRSSWTAISRVESSASQCSLIRQRRCAREKGWRGLLTADIAYYSTRSLQQLCSRAPAGPWKSVLQRMRCVARPCPVAAHSPLVLITRRRRPPPVGETTSWLVQGGEALPQTGDEKLKLEQRQGDNGIQPQKCSPETRIDVCCGCV